MISDTDREIEQLEAKLQALKDGKKSFAEMSPEKRLATIMHDKFCHWNHTDGCGWFYESWSSPQSNNTHSEYLNKARALLLVLSGNYELAVQVVNVIK